MESPFGVESSRLNKKQTEGLREFLRCIDEGFNGSLVFHFRNGSPESFTRPQLLGEETEGTTDLTARRSGT